MRNCLFGVSRFARSLGLIKHILCVFLDPGGSTVPSQISRKGSSKGKFSEGRKGSQERFQVGKMRWPEIGFLVLKKVVSGHLLKIGFLSLKSS